MTTPSAPGTPNRFYFALYMVGDTAEGHTSSCGSERPFGGCSLLRHGELDLTAASSPVSEADALAAAALEMGQGDVAGAIGPSAPLSHVIVDVGPVAAEELDCALRTMAHSSSASTPPTVLRLPQASWQSAFLKQRERASEESIAKGKQTIAHQLVGDFGAAGDTSSNLSLQPPHMEAILMGYAALFRLGWLPGRRPAIRRSANGKLVKGGDRPQAMCRKARKRAARQRGESRNIA